MKRSNTFMTMLVSNIAILRRSRKAFQDFQEFSESLYLLLKRVYRYILSQKWDVENIFWILPNGIKKVVRALILHIYYYSKKL